MATASPFSPLREQRTERRLMRLRGAGTREVTTDFGFAFSLSASSTDHSVSHVGSRPARSDIDDVGHSRKRSRRCSSSELSRVKILKSKQGTDCQTDIKSTRTTASDSLQPDAEKRLTAPAASQTVSATVEASPAKRSKRFVSQHQSNGKIDTHSTTTKYKTHAEEFRYRKKSDQVYRSPSTTNQKTAKSAEQNIVDATAISARAVKFDKYASRVDDGNVAIERKLQPTEKQDIEPLRGDRARISSRKDATSNEAIKAATGPSSSASVSRITLAELDVNHSPSRRAQPRKSFAKNKSAQSETCKEATKAEHNPVIGKRPVDQLSAQPSSNVTRKTKLIQPKTENPRQMSRKVGPEKREQSHIPIDLEVVDSSSRIARQRPEVTKKDEKRDTTQRSDSESISKYAAQSKPHQLSSTKYRSLPSAVDEMDLDDLLANIASLAKDKKSA